jgi:hypothetical protein
LIGVRKAFVVPALAAALLISAIGVATAGSATKKPAADVVFAQSVRVVGTHFKPKEHVTVTLAGTDQKWTRKAVAKKTGAFSVDFGAIPLNACNAYTVKVVGSLKSRASLSHPVEPC